MIETIADKIFSFGIAVMLVIVVIGFLKNKFVAFTTDNFEVSVEKSRLINECPLFQNPFVELPKEIRDKYTDAEMTGEQEWALKGEGVTEDLAKVDFMKKLLANGCNAAHKVKSHKELGRYLVYGDALKLKR